MHQVGHWLRLTSINLLKWKTYIDSKIKKKNRRLINIKLTFMLAFIHHKSLCLYHHHPLLTEIVLISAHQILGPNVITTCSEIQVVFSPQRIFYLRLFFVVVFKILIYISCTSYFCFTAKTVFLCNWCHNYTYDYSSYIYGIWSPEHPNCVPQSRTNSAFRLKLPTLYVWSIYRTYLGIQHQQGDVS